MNPELANRLRRFGETVDQAALDVQAGKAAPRVLAEDRAVIIDDTDDLPAVVLIAARRRRRYHTVTAAAAAAIVVVAGALIAARVTGNRDPAPAGSTNATITTTVDGSASTTTSVARTTSTLPAGLPGASTPASSSSTTSSSSTEPPSEPRVCPDGYNAYDHRYPIQLCDEGPAVRHIQYKTGAPVDGAFGPATRQSVRAFQELHGLTPDGLVGIATWTAMFPEGAPGVDTDGNGTVEPWEVS